LGNLGKVGYGCWCALRPLELLGSFLEALWGLLWVSSWRSFWERWPA